MSVSRTGDAIVERAKECYELGLIDTRQLERVIVLAERPGYNPILDLPLQHKLDEARKLARKAQQQEVIRRGWRKWLRQ